MIQRTRGKAGRVIALVRTGLVGGLLVAAVAYPLAAVAGLGVKAGPMTPGSTSTTAWT